MYMYIYINIHKYVFLLSKTILETSTTVLNRYIDILLT